MQLCEYANKQVLEGNENFNVYSTWSALDEEEKNTFKLLEILSSVFVSKTLLCPSAFLR